MQGLATNLLKSSLSVYAVCDKSLNKRCKPVECAKCENKFDRDCFKKIENTPKVQPGWVCHNDSGLFSLKVTNPPPPHVVSLRKRMRIDYDDLNEVSDEETCDIPILPTVSSKNSSPSSSISLHLQLYILP